MSTPKENKVVFDNNNDNSNTQTPRTPKSQNSSKQFRATPSPKRNRKPLFDDTPPIQRYSVKMAKDRFKSSKDYRKEIRDIFHQSDQFAIFQQKSALVVPTELTPERYVLGKFNTAPDKNQKDRGISRKVTRRTDLLDRRNYVQDTPQYYNNKDNSEVLVEEIEEIDVITEEQNSNNNTFEPPAKYQSYEPQASDLQLNTDATANMVNHINDENEGGSNTNQPGEGNNIVHNEIAKTNDNASEEEIEDDYQRNERDIQIEAKEEEDRNEYDSKQDKNNADTTTNKEDFPYEVIEEEETSEDVDAQNKENINDLANANVIQRSTELQLEEEEQDDQGNQQDGEQENQGNDEQENHEIENQENKEQENHEIENQENEEQENHANEEQENHANEEQENHANEEQENHENEEQENHENEEQENQGNEEQENHENEEQENHENEEQENHENEEQENHENEEQENHENEEQENHENEEQENHENEEQENHENEEQENHENEEQENHENEEQENEEIENQENQGNEEQENHENEEQENHENEEQENHENEEIENHANEEQENHENEEQENHANEEQENHANEEQENQGNEEQENHASEEQENEEIENQENKENEEIENHANEEQENQENEEQENEEIENKEQENQENEENENHAKEEQEDHSHDATYAQPSDQDDDIPLPDIDDEFGHNRSTRRSAEPFMPPCSPPRFKKLDRNDPKINHTGDQLLEISLRPYLYSLTNKYGTPIKTIREIPTMEFNDWQSMGFDWVWLYGVWQIGDQVIEHDLIDGTLLKRYSDCLPDWQREDVIGYPLCIFKYEVCPEVGSEEDLQWFRMEMKKRGIKLMLDFVPNDTAIDAPEMESNPEFYIRSIVPPNSNDSSQKFDHNRFMANHNGVAFGAGEHMPPMHFNAQLNLFNKKCRDYQINRMLKVSQLCDGLRIHLAQYLINSKFADFWGNQLFAQDSPNVVDVDYQNENEEFWSLAISKIRQNLPNFVMVAESYGYENQAKLLNCGFNYVYEKELLDKLVYSDVKGFRDLIFKNEFLTSKKMVHFVENHDEARVLHRFWKDERMACAASAALLTLPGIRLINFHQWLGYMNQIDVNLRRCYDPHINKYIMLFYVRLFRVLDTNAIRFGEWTPKNVYESETVIAWKWVKGKQHILVAINFSMNRSGGRIICNDAPTDTREITVHELISNTYYTRDPQELIDTGLCLSLDKYETQIFEY